MRSRFLPRVDAWRIPGSRRCPVSSPRPGRSRKRTRAFLRSVSAHSSPPPCPTHGASPDAFAEASLFFHAAETLNYFRALGWERPWPDGKPPLRLVANARMPSRDGKALLPWADALFVPSGGVDARTHDTLWFGRSPGVNLAYDGDTIAHEVTHALLEPFLPRSDWRLDAFGADGSPGAIDEGLADYFAAAAPGGPLPRGYAVRG